MLKRLILLCAVILLCPLPLQASGGDWGAMLAIVFFLLVLAFFSQVFIKLALLRIFLHQSGKLTRALLLAPADFIIATIAVVSLAQPALLLVYLLLGFPLLFANAWLIRQPHVTYKQIFNEPRRFFKLLAITFLPSVAVFLAFAILHPR